MKLLNSAAGDNTYHFICEGCNCEGELVCSNENGVRINCPENCGASYIQWTNPESNSSDLMCVIRPIFRSELVELEDDEDEDSWDPVGRYEQDIDDDPNREECVYCHGDNPDGYCDSSPDGRHYMEPREG